MVRERNVVVVVDPYAGFKASEVVKWVLQLLQSHAALGEVRWDFSFPTHHDESVKRNSFRDWDACCFEEA